MKENKRHEIYRNGRELEMIAYLDNSEFETYALKHNLRRISTRVEVNDAGQAFEVYAYVVEEAAEDPAEVEKMCREYKELQRLQEELSAEIEALKESIKAAMHGAETLTAGCFKVAHKMVTTSRLDSAALKKALPDVAAAFTRTTQSRRFAIV